MCIAPVLLGLLAREKSFSCKITLGDGSAKSVILDMNHWNVQVISCKIDEYCLDEDHLFVTVPAYMISNATSKGIFDSAMALVQGLKKLLKI
jgi:enhancing lycopene biosynthesis protein 2